MISLAIIVVGIFHCRSNAFTHSLNCSEIECTLIKSSTNESFHFKKEDLVDAAVVRIDKAGTFVSDKLVRESQKSSKFGYSVRVKFRSASVETAAAESSSSSSVKTNKEALISTQDMGRRKCRMWAADIEKYIQYRPDSEADTTSSKKKKQQQRNRHKTISLQFSKSVTFVGLMLVMFGAASCIAACYFGQWSEKTRRGRLKKAY